MLHIRHSPVKPTVAGSGILLNANIGGRRTPQFFRWNPEVAEFRDESPMGLTPCRCGVLIATIPSKSLTTTRQRMFPAASFGGCFNLAKDVESVFGENRMVRHCRLLHRLGQGAFGEVWTAIDLKLDKSVAVKIPRRTHLSEEKNQQVPREARANAHVRHPNIVAVHDIGCDNGPHRLLVPAANFCFVEVPLCDEEPANGKHNLPA